MDYLRSDTPPRVSKKKHAPVSPRKAAEVKVAKKDAGSIEGLDLKKRLSLLRRSTGIEEDHVREYQRLDILRQSINKVKKDADVNHKLRKNPKSLYGNVKSKVSANIKSANKANKKRSGYHTTSTSNGIYSLSQTAKSTRFDTDANVRVHETVDIKFDVQGPPQPVDESVEFRDSTPEPVQSEPKFTSPEKEETAVSNDVMME